MPRPIYALAYPRLTTADRRWIDDFRARHDLPYKDVVAPHFTMVFGCDAIDEAAFREHVEAVAGRFAPIAFHCRYAMLAADDVSETGYVFLVPDEGNSAIALLHDQLYTGLLRPHLRLDLEYIPHINIGTQNDRGAAKALCDGINQAGISISGRIDTLTVSVLDAGRIEDLAAFALCG